MKFLKTMLALALCLVLLAGCGGGQTAQGDEQDNEQQNPAPEGPVYGEDGAKALALLPQISGEYELPDCVDTDLQSLDRAANWLFFSYGICGMNVNLDLNDTVTAGEYAWTYYRDKNFADYAAFETAVLAVFTPECAARFLASDTILKAENGGLYCLDGGIGSDISYVGTAFVVASETAQEIVVDVNATFNDSYPENWPNDPDPAQDRVETSKLVFKQTDAGWRIDAFSVPAFGIQL